MVTESYRRRDFLRLLVGVGTVSATSFIHEKTNAKGWEDVKPVFIRRGIAADLAADTVNFSWTREQVLFGPNAGFEELRHGGSVGVWTDTSMKDLDLYKSIEGWNHLAKTGGRKNDLFFVATDKSNAQVVFIKSNENRVIALPDYKDHYTNCVVRMYGPDEYVAAHELGHVLGFVDFMRRSDDKTTNVNPQLCDGGIPIKSVMSFCSGDRKDEWFGGDDMELLRLAGYIN